MHLQIDVFPSGRGSAAVCVRYGCLGDYRILLYDSGVADTGVAIVKHIQEQYETEIVDDVVCSHPNMEHVLGMWPVLSKLRVRRLWQHRPWQHSEQIARYVMHGEARNDVLQEHYDHTVDISHVIEQEALHHGTPVLAPFQGVQIGPFTVLGPHPEWYMHTLVPQFSLPQDAASGTTAVCAEMESSVVLYGEIGGQGILLTGNAGPMALTRATNYAQLQRIAIAKRLALAQMPHCGDSKHLTPALLDRLIGTALPAAANMGENTGLNKTKRSVVTALIVAPESRPGNSHRSLTEALHRRGVSIAQISNTAEGPFRLQQDEADKPFRLVPLSTQQETGAPHGKKLKTIKEAL